MSKVVRAIVGVAAIVVGVVVPGAQFLIAVGASILASTAAEILAGSGKGQSRQVQIATLSIGESPREALFGEVASAGSLLDGFNYGGTYNTDWEVLAIALADHRCEALVGFYVNDAYVPFAGNGEVAGYGGQLRVTWHNGASDQAADATLVSRGGWSASDRLAGTAYVVVEYKADKPDAKNPIWPGGRPRFLWQVRGKLCYDPRKDSSVQGGSGPQRWSSPATWAWTDNLAVCRYNWVRGVYACDQVDDPKQLLVGRGLSPAEAPPERLAAPANVCDELVDGEPRYRCAAVIASDEVFADVEVKFAVACAGITTQPEGSIELEPGQAKPIVAFITDADLIVGKAITFSDYRSEADEEWCNTVVAQYVEPTQKWAMHSAPVTRIPADVIADRGPRERKLQLEYCRHVKQAQRCAEIVRRLGRLPRTAMLTVGPRFSELEEGDWIACRLRRTKNQTVFFRIDGYSSDETRQMSLTLREIAPSVFGAATVYTDRAAAVQQAAPPSVAFDGQSSRLVDAGFYSAAPTYQRGDLVTYEGSSWLYVADAAGAGFSPPSLPTTVNARWRLFARTGLEGPPGQDGADGRNGRDGTDGTNGLNGKDGRDGNDGADGRTPQFHFAWSNSLSGTVDFTTGEQGGRTFQGVYVDYDPGADSADPARYTWSRYTGQDGKDGTDGIEGPPGEDGRPSYVHKAYSNSPNGSVDFSRTDPDGRAYLGLYIDFTQADSTDPAAYAWSLIKGVDAITIEPSAASVTFFADYLGTLKPNQLGQTVRMSFNRGAADVSSQTAWTVEGSACTPAISAAGVVSFSAVTGDGEIRVTGVHQGVTRLKKVPVTLAKDNPPANEDTKQSRTVSIGVGVDQFPSTAASGGLPVRAGPGGSIKFEFSGSYSANSAGNVTLQGIFAYRLSGSSDPFTYLSAGAVNGTRARYRTGPGGDPIDEAGSLVMQQSQGGMTAGTLYDTGLFLRRIDGTVIAIGGGTMTVTGE